MAVSGKTRILSVRAVLRQAQALKKRVTVDGEAVCSNEKSNDTRSAGSYQGLQYEFVHFGWMTSRGLKKCLLRVSAMVEVLGEAPSY